MQATGRSFSVSPRIGPTKFWSIHVAGAGIAAQASRGCGDQQVLDRAPARRVVLLVNNFLLIAHHGNDDHDRGRKTLLPGESELVFAHRLALFLRGPRTAACRAATKRSRPAPENTWKRHGWVNLWLGAQWAASSSSSIHSRGISVGRYSFTERRVLIAVSASSRGRSVVVCHDPTS